MAVATDRYYAREADRLARGPQLYGGNADIVKLRCFKYYHPDQGSFLTDPTGRNRWLGPKMSRVYAILHRAADTGQRVTMHDIAREAGCCASTVSRAVQRLQAFGFFAIDITRGRNGGIMVRMRRAGDALKHYASAAWRRIRSWLNVASRSSVSEGEYVYLPVLADATFTEDRAIERDGARVLAGEISVDEAIAATRRRRGRTAPDVAGPRTAADFAAAVIAERRRLAIIDPVGEREAVAPLWS